ncbi:MAG: NlpC/P60 family protein [Anaerocolumna sp.]
MVNQTAVKASLCAAALLLTLGFSGVTARAATTVSDRAVAGITVAYDDYIKATPNETAGEAEKLLASFVQQTEEVSNEEDEEVAKVESPYANLGVSIANDYVNIRTEANTESEIVGKLYRGCATDILETEGEWVKIQSGNVKGYIKSEFLAIGEEAEELVDEYASKYAVVNTETLYVREKPSTKATITTMIPMGERYYIIKESKHWVKIMLDGDETGFIAKDYINIEVEFEYAISVEEEQAKAAAEEAARQAEAERLQELAEEKEAQRRAEEAAKEAAEKESNQNSSSGNSSSSGSGSSSSSGSGSSSSSATGQAIANYALKFVGNPYVWGGTSLTNGADCSGFVQSIYAHFGYSITRTSRDQAASAGVKVSVSNLQPGDLLFYANSSGTVNHVALYIGNGRVVHASNAREGIKTSAYNYRSIYCARRIIN